MIKSQLKKKIFITPEKPGAFEKTFWVEEEKVKKIKPKTQAKK